MPDLQDIECRLVTDSEMEIPIGWHAHAWAVHEELRALLPNLRYAEAKGDGSGLHLEPYPRLQAKQFARPGEPYMDPRAQDALLGTVRVHRICAWCGQPGRAAAWQLAMCDVHRQLSDAVASMEGKGPVTMDGPALRQIRDHFERRPPFRRPVGPA
jgi:hypothetical protein